MALIKTWEVTNYAEGIAIARKNGHAQLINLINELLAEQFHEDERKPDNPDKSALLSVAVVQLISPVVSPYFITPYGERCTLGEFMVLNEIDDFPTAETRMKEIQVENMKLMMRAQGLSA